MIIEEYSILREEERPIPDDVLLVDFIRELIKSNPAEDIYTITAELFWKLCAEPTKKEVTFFKSFCSRKSIAIVFYNTQDVIKGYVIFTATMEEDNFKEFILEELFIDTKRIYKYPKKKEVVNFKIM